MKVRKTTKRMHTENWRPWQLEEYIGVHESREWTPAYDARGYQFHPVFVVQSPPVDQSRYPTPQLITRGLKQPKEVTVWEKIKRWATA